LGELITTERPPVCGQEAQHRRASLRPTRFICLTVDILNRRQRQDFVDETAKAFKGQPKRQESLELFSIGPATKVGFERSDCQTQGKALCAAAPKQLGAY
jgi:hypothetical protein